MEEHTGILIRKPVILREVSYAVLETDDRTIPLVIFKVYEEARANVSKLDKDSYVTVKGNWKINKDSGVKELAVTYLAELNLTDPPQEEEDELEKALKLIRDTPREIVKEKAAKLQSKQEELSISTDDFHMI